MTNSKIELSTCYLLEDNLLFNFEDEGENGGTNKSKNNIFFKEELTTTGTNLQPETSDLPILIHLKLDSTLPSLNITATNIKAHRQEPQKAKSNVNKKI